MAEFELILLTAFSLGVLLTLLFQSLFFVNVRPRDDHGDDAGHRGLDLPDVLYVSRAGKCFHLDQNCFSIPKKNEMVDLQCCKHCLNSSLKKRKAKWIKVRWFDMTVADRMEKGCCTTMCLYKKGSKKPILGVQTGTLIQFWPDFVEKPPVQTMKEPWFFGSILGIWSRHFVEGNHAHRIL